MPKMDLTRSTLDNFSQQLQELTPDTERQWGELDVVHMLRHLIFTLDISLGNVEVQPFTPKLVRPLFYLFALNWFTNWPKGKLKAPDYVCPDPEGDFQTKRALVLTRIYEFVDILDNHPTRISVNPGLGPITMTRCARVHGIHTDHHLRQFGV